ncbi:hypothetical protein HGRIS_013515 [Hohenbuehelia grisea]|uniref:Uncharacterized protein n=1 Tax=Hohenbuehelia grisea TaxID=104357 RepID=A0ABR3IVW6_9AGAR
MNTHFIDNPLLVAPRPVRIATAPSLYIQHYRPPSRSIPSRSNLSAPTFAPTPVEQLEKLRITDDLTDDDQRASPLSPYDPPSDKPISPCASPRATLPSEALEEFLSILRPSCFPPTSPILRGRRTIPTLPYDRPSAYAYKRALVHQPKSDSLGGDEAGADRAPSRSAVTASPESAASERDELEDLPVRWYTSAALSSPVSRMHTRNPFQRHPSYEITLTSPLPTNGASLSPHPLEPAAIPLPLPTPDEIHEISPLA